MVLTYFASSVELKDAMELVVPLAKSSSSSALQHSLVHDFKTTIAHTYTHSNENHTSFIISAQRAFGGKDPYLLLCWTIWKRFMNGQFDGVV